MSRLSDLISGAVTLALETKGVVMPHDVARAVKPQLDADDRDRLIDAALADMVAKAARSAKRAVSDVAASQGSFDIFPKLRSAYALDAEERTVKDTGSLSMLEFKRLIAIREKQIEDDRAHLKVLRDAYSAVRPFWDEHAEWSFSQAYRAFAATERAA